MGKLKLNKLINYFIVITLTLFFVAIYIGKDKLEKGLIEENSIVLENTYSDIPKVWISKDNSIDKNIDYNNKLIEYTHVLNQEFTLESLKVYDGYFDFGELVVAYCENQKIVLANIVNGEISYIAFPDKELLHKFYELEGIYNYDIEGVPKELLVDLQNNTLDYEKYKYGNDLSKEELEKWITEYYRQNDDSEALDEISGGYVADVTNDGFEDIILTTVLGTGHYHYLEVMVNNGDNEYELLEENYINNLNSGGETTIKYKGKTYIHVLKHGAANTGKYLCYYEADSLEILQQYIEFTNYDIGFEITNTWSKEGYEEIISHIKSRAYVANNNKPSVMGTAEVGAKVEDTYSDFLASGDYNNDGMVDNIQKMNVGQSYIGEYIYISTDDEKLNEVLNNIQMSDRNGFLQCVFLDETPYGNSVILAFGVAGEIYSFESYLINGYEAELIGRVDVDNIDFETVEVDY